MLGAAAISRTRVATCAAKAPTTARNSNQKASVATGQCRSSIAGSQDGRQYFSVPSACAPAILRSSRFHRVDHRRHDLEQVADDAVVGDFEDRRVGILVDRDDGARRPSCRPGAGSRPRCRARGTASARRSGPSFRPGAPSAASRRRRSDATRRSRRRAHRRAVCASGDVRLLLDAAADRHDALGLREIDRLLRLLKRRLGLLADRRRVDGDAQRAHRRRRRALRDLVDAIGADLERDEVRRRPLRHDVGGQLALEHRPDERRSRQPDALMPVTSVSSARSSRAASFGAKSRV